MEETNQQQYDIHPAIAAEAGISSKVEPVEQPQPEIQTPIQQLPPAQLEQQSFSRNEENVRKLRIERDRLQREREELLQLIQDTKKPSHSNTVSPLVDIPVGDDDIVEGKHLKNYYQKLQKQQEDIIKAQEQSNKIYLESKLRSEMPDLDKVISQDNIETLRTLYPEIAQTIASDSNTYTQGKSAYQMIKSLGIYKEDKYQDDRRRAQENANKPRPLSSVSPQQGESPLSHANSFANGLTDDLKKSLYKEMMDATKNKW